MVDSCEEATTVQRTKYFREKHVGIIKETVPMTVVTCINDCDVTRI